MRKTTVLLLAILLVMAMTTVAVAADVTTTFNGQYRIRGIALNNADANDDANDHKNYYDSRFRLGITCATSENLSGTIWFEIGDMVWGVEGTGGRLGADERAVEVKNAYILYITDFGLFKMGIFGVKSPKGIVIDEDAPTIAFATRPVEELTIKIGVIKGFEGGVGSGFGSEDNYDRDIEAYFLEGFYQFTPEIMGGMYLFLVNDNIGAGWGNPSGQSDPILCDSAQIYFLGFTSEAKFDMLNLSADFVFSFGSIENSIGHVSDVTTGNATDPTDIDIAGYAIDVRGDVDIDAGVGLKVGALIAYSSGDEDDVADDEISYFVTLRPNWDYVNNIWADQKEGGYMLHAGDGISDPLGIMAFGIWASANPTEKTKVMLNFTNMNYVEDDPDGNTDIGNEIDLNTYYNINKNLSVNLKLAALIPGDAYNETDDDDLVTEYMWTVMYKF